MQHYIFGHTGDKDMNHFRALNTTGLYFLSGLLATDKLQALCCTLFFAAM